MEETTSHGKWGWKGTYRVGVGMTSIMVLDSWYNNSINTVLQIELETMTAVRQLEHGRP